MIKTREQRIQEHNRLAAMRKDVENELLKIPGVVRVSIGLKVVNNLPVEEICFRVYVGQKKPLSEIPPGEKIPARIRDIKTDVNQIPTNVSACGSPDDGKYRPLAGGTKISSAKAIQVGTLGCLAVDNATEFVVLLSTYHILMLNGEEEGHQIAQPDFCCDLCCCRCGEIAKLERGAWADENVDCAIARLTGEHQDKWTNEVLGIGSVSALPLKDDGKPVDPPRAGDTVFKRGMNSGLTEGIIIEEIDAAVSVDVKYETKDGVITQTFTGQLLIGPKSFDQPFTRKGDSGAVIVNHLNQVIGLHFADNEVRDNRNRVITDATQSYANPIWDVISALDISIPDAGTLHSLNLKYSAGPTRPPEKDILAELEKTIEQHPDGRILTETFRLHRYELMQLINNDREVKVAWHRYHGPSFTAHIMEKVKNPDYNVPTSIEGISYQRLLSKMSVVLEKKSSQEMASAIDKYSTKVFALAAGLVHSFNGNESLNITDLHGYT